MRYAIVDALADDDLVHLAEACADLALVTGGSGAAIGLPQNFRRAGLLGNAESAAILPAVGGPAAVLSGSCSTATLQQVEVAKQRFPSQSIDPVRLADNPESFVNDIVAWATSQLPSGPVLIFASAAPNEVADVQARFGRERSGLMIEEAIANIAKALVQSGVRRLVVAGGETSGAVVSALGIDALEIGPQIDPGIPATLSYGNPRIALALKSGNFGGADFFAKAVEALR